MYHEICVAISKENGSVYTHLVMIKTVCNLSLFGVYLLVYILYNYNRAMSSNAVIIGSIIGAFIGTCFLLSILIIFYCFWCCVVYVASPQDEYKVSDLRFRRRLKKGRGLKEMLISITGIYSRQKRKDLEDQIDIDKPPSSVTNCDTNFNSNSTSSRLALKSFSLPSDGINTPQVCMSNVKDVNIIPCLNKDDTTSYSLEYKDAIERFDLSDGIFSTETEKTSTLKAKHLSNTRQMSSLTYLMDGSDSNNFVTIVSKPSESEQSFISDQYDSFTRTVMLQNFIGNSANTTQKNVIKELHDPFLDNLIPIGGIVVVVRPFNGVNDFEFVSLQPGDLLRIVRFYVKGEIDTSFGTDKHDGDSTDIADFENESVHDALFKNGIHISRSDPNYVNIYCTGILLNTYLEYNKQTHDLSLRFKKDSARNEFALLKDFPLKAVSLETTVLRTVSNSPVANDALEGHFD